MARVSLTHPAAPGPFSSPASVPPAGPWPRVRVPALPWSSSEIRPLTALRGSLVARLPPRLRLRDWVDQDPEEGLCCCTGAGTTGDWAWKGENLGLDGSMEQRKQGFYEVPV